MKKRNLDLVLIGIGVSIALTLSLTFVFTSFVLAADQPAATARPGRVVIPTIALDSPIVPVGVKPIIINGKTYGILEVADNEVGWHALSADLGQKGNSVLVGHSDIKARVFHNLKDASIGDEVIVFSDSGQEVYHYIITQKFLVKEKGVSLDTRIKNAQWIAPTQDKRLTLVTCAGLDATHRLIVIARPATN